MTDIVNLNKARKKRQSAAKRAAADANRIRFGQKKATREATRKSKAADARRLDGHRLDSNGPLTGRDDAPGDS